MKQNQISKGKLTSQLFSIICIALLLVSSGAFGQSITSSMIGTTGETFTEGSYFLDFTLGEISVESYQNQESLLTQGFLQGSEESTAVEEFQKQNVHLEIYPNPVSHTLNLKYKTEFKPRRCEIVSIMGETTLNMPIDKTTCSIKVSALKPGLYFLKLRFSDQSFAIQPFIKK